MVLYWMFGSMMITLFVKVFKYLPNFRQLNSAISFLRLSHA